jgi:hypothetical protein
MVRADHSQAIGQICATAKIYENLEQCRNLAEKAVAGGAKVSEERLHCSVFES